MSLDNEIYHALAEQTADHILVTDPEGIILYVNPAFETLTGYSQKEVLGKTPRILKSGEHERDFYTKLWDTVLSGQTFRGMSINKKKDGSLYYEEKTITPVKDVDGQITHLISTGKDVTERVEAERSLAKSEEYNRHILGNVLDGVVSMNENGRIIGWNKEAEQIFGWSAKDIIGRLMTETIIPKQHRRNHTKGLKHYNKTGEGPILNRRVEITGLHAKGHEFPIELAVTPSKQDDQNIFHAFVQDISQRKKAENKIQQYQEALKEKADSLATINALADSLHRALDYQAVITRATEAIVKFTQAPSLAFYSLDESGERMQLLASHGFSKDAVQIGATLPIKGTLSGITLTQRQVVTSEDIEADERIEPALRQAMLAQKLNHVISLPLLFQEQALGVINLVYADAQLFNEQDIETLLTIGKTIGLALVNAQRMNDIQLNEAQARLHLKTSQALAASQTPDEVIDIIVEKSAYYPQVAISLFLLENMGETAVLKLRKVNMAESGLPQLPASTQIPSGDLPQIFSSDQSFIIEDILASKQTSQVQEFVSQSGAVSLVTLPLTSGGEWLGTLVAISPEKAFFREEHLTVYHDIVEQGALALRAEKLNEEARTTLVRREREVTLATQVAQEIAEATNLHDLYQRVVTQVQEQFGYYFTQLLRYNVSMDILGLVVGYGDVGQKMLAMNHSMPIGVGLIGTAASTKQSMLQGNVVNDLNWQSNPLLPKTRSELAVPIKLRDEVLGVLDVQSDKVEGITTDDQLLLEGLCGQIAIAIESTELRQEMEGKLHELNLLQQEISHEGWQKHQQRRQDHIGYQFDLSGLQQLTTTPESSAENGNNGALSSEKQVISPLVVRGKAIGSFGVEDDPERPLTDEEYDIINAVAAELAEALEAARLFEQTQMALAEKERLASELETVAQVSTAAATILDVNELLQAVVDLAKSGFSLYHAHIYLANEAGNKLSLKAGAGNIGNILSLEGREINLSDIAIVARAARSRKGVLENNVRRTIDFLPHPLLAETRAEMALPMMVGGKLIGVLDLQSDEENFFTEEDLNVQTTLAAQIAVAVENANQYAAQVKTANKLRQVDQLKSEFLASMSHELRTPLNSIIGFADVLLEGLDGELNDRMEEDVRLIRSSGDHLKGLIGDILDMSKIEAGRMDLRYEEIDMVEMANDVVATAAPLAQEKGIFFHLDLDRAIKSVQADRTRLRQVLWNIVGNAIKFTDKGSVTVSIHAKPTHLLCSVRDTGIGIQEEQVGVVFEQFRQIDGGLNRAAGGTGLGMPITRKLVELHGGEIWIESVYGQGSTFLFTIPYQPPKKKLTSADALAESD